MFFHRNSPRHPRAHLKHPGFILLCILLLLSTFYLLCLRGYVGADDAHSFKPPFWAEDPREENTSPVSNNLENIPAAETTATPLTLNPEELLSEDVDTLLQKAKTKTILWEAKSKSGKLGYISALPLAIESGASNSSFAQEKALKALLARDDIHTIAKLSCFADNILAEHIPSLAFRRESGAIWRDEEGTAWLNPQNEVLQDYLFSLCKELMALGFDEILLTEACYPTQTDNLPSYIITKRAEDEKTAMLDSFYARCNTLFLEAGVSSSILWESPQQNGLSVPQNGQDLPLLVANFQEIWLYGDLAQAKMIFSSRGLSIPESFLRVIPAKNEGKYLF